MAEYVDQFHTQGGWQYTEDISFLGTATLALSSTPGTVRRFPLVFTQAPLTSFNRVPDASHGYLVLRKLAISCQNPPGWRNPTWLWSQSSQVSFSVPATTTGFQSTQQYLCGPTPAGLSTINIPVSLRRIIFGTIPANVTVTLVEVRPDWTTNTFDPVTFANSTSGSSIDLATFYDGNYGLTNTNVNVGTTTAVDIRFTVNNTNASSQFVPVNFYGMQLAYQWAQWLVQYEPIGNKPYVLGQIDDSQNPVSQFTLDKLIPFTISDTGITNLGNLTFTANQQVGFFNANSVYDIMLTATMAYLIP